MKFVIILFAAICIAAAADFKEDWHFYSLGCKVSTISDPENTSPVNLHVMTFGADPRCTNDTIGMFENACLRAIAYETNNFDLSKPIQGPGSPKSYGQISCDRIGKKDVHTSLTLSVTYKCVGSKPNEEEVHFTYDLFKKIGKKVDLNCVNGLFVNV